MKLGIITKQYAQNEKHNVHVALWDCGYLFKNS